MFVFQTNFEQQTDSTSNKKHDQINFCTYAKSMLCLPCGYCITILGIISLVQIIITVLN